MTAVEAPFFDLDGTLLDGSGVRTAVAIDRLAVAPANVWHMGDNLATDVAGANAAGPTSVWLNRTGRSRGPADAEPDFEIRSLADLSALFEGHRARKA